MHLARVIGTVVATRKAENMDGIKLLLIQPVNEKKESKGEPVVAVDPNVQAGPGSLVSYVVGREAMLGLPKPFAPVDAGIVGIVDDVNVDIKVEEQKEAR